MTKPNKKAVVLCSGGLDSATTLALAHHRGFVCHSLAIDYGQRHRAELFAAERIAQQLGAIDHCTLRIDLRTIGGSALTDPQIAVPESPANTESDTEPKTGIPITYVPARNTVFLSLALGQAEVLGATAIFIGVNAVDYSGYPDCRPQYLRAFAQLAKLATKAAVEGHLIAIEAPLLHLTKAQIIARGHQLGIDYAATVSCYQADPQGRACGRCDSCHLRRQGFIAANLPDPTRYQPTAPTAPKKA
ncbi:MAG: 7-cyano-7-deazaguanine synthase QueC [Cellvibrionales bacterium]|nr:7-cyano-7-deazaguanine synthase QueC [Cellvibrionales bacterium]